MKVQETVKSISFMLALATVCAATFWFVLHSKEKAVVDRQMAFESMTGRTAPAFRLKTVEGNAIGLQHLKRPLVLELFATWCDICQSEVPTLNRLHSVKNLDVVAVSGDKRGMHGRRESLEDLRAFRNQFGAKYDIAFDPSAQVARAYGIVGFPSIFIIGVDGRIVYNTAGQTSLSELTDHLPRERCAPGSRCS